MKHPGFTADASLGGFSRYRSAVGANSAPMTVEAALTTGVCGNKKGCAFEQCYCTEFLQGYWARIPGAQCGHECIYY